MNLLDLPYDINYYIIECLGPVNLDNLFWTNSYYHKPILNYLKKFDNNYKSNLSKLNYEIFKLNYNLLNRIPITLHYMNYYNFSYKIFTMDYNEINDIKIKKFIHRKNLFEKKEFIRNYSKNVIINHKNNILFYKKLDRKQLKYFTMLLLYYNKIKKMI